MRHQQVLSLLLRAGALSAALVGLVSHAPPARSAAPALQASTVVPKVPNLVGYWPMNSATGGIVSDLSGTSPANNGTLNGGATIDTTNKAAVPSGNPGSLGLAASGDTVSVPDSASLSVTGSVSVAAWVRPTAAPVTSGPQHGVIEKWDSGTVNGYFLRLSPKNELKFTICSPTANVEAGSYPRQVPTSVWTHVAGVYDFAAGSIKIYKSDDDAIDLGAPDPSMVSSGVAPPGDGTSFVSIGDGLGAHNFIGNIDEARIYSKALTQNEIAILVSMNQPPTGTMTANVVSNQVVMGWGAASNAASVPVVYSVLRGTSPGVYDTVFNNINALTFSDTPPASGTYYYTVAAVSVIPSSYATEQTVIYSAAPPPPPPPPPAPRTSKVGNENDPCGCGSAAPPGSRAGLLGAALAVAAFLIRPRRRT